MQTPLQLTFEHMDHSDRIEARMLGDVEQQGECKLLDRAPSLPDLLRVQRVRPAAQHETTRLLTAITENLYRSLNERQRIRAARLLLPLCNELGLGKAALHRLPH